VSILIPSCRWSSTCESCDRLLLPYPSSASNTSSRRTGGRSPRILCWPWLRHVSTTATRCWRVCLPLSIYSSHYRKSRTVQHVSFLTRVIMITSRHVWYNSGHWLPVRARIQCKLARCLMYGVYNNSHTSLTLYNRPRRRQRVDVYIQLTQPTTSSRDCVPSSLNVVSLMCGTVCLNHFAERNPRPRQPSNANWKRFYSAMLLTLSLMIHDCFLSDLTIVTVYFVNFKLCNALVVFHRVMRALENV